MSHRIFQRKMKIGSVTKSNLIHLKSLDQKIWSSDPLNQIKIWLIDRPIIITLTSSAQVTQFKESIYCLNRGSKTQLQESINYSNLLASSSTQIFWLFIRFSLSYLWKINISFIAFKFILISQIQLIFSSFP